MCVCFKNSHIRLNSKVCRYIRMCVLNVEYVHKPMPVIVGSELVTGGCHATKVYGVCPDRLSTNAHTQRHLRSNWEPSEFGIYVLL